MIGISIVSRSSWMKYLLFKQSLFKA